MYFCTIVPRAFWEAIVRFRQEASHTTHHQYCFSKVFFILFAHPRKSINKYIKRKASKPLCVNSTVVDGSTSAKPCRMPADRVEAQHLPQSACGLSLGQPDMHDCVV